MYVSERRLPPRITLPKLAFLNEAPPPEDAREIAARFAEQRIIRAGVDSWQAITKAESFEGWKAIGRALAIGRTHALRVTGANRPMGRRYSRVFCEWITRHGFDQMPKSVRSVALELNENIAAIEEWRATLSDREQRRCVHPLSNVRRWQKATAPDKPDIASDPVRAATAAWRRFVTSMEALAPDQAAPLWQAAQEQAAASM
jgi:hypothetical protein